MKASYAEISLAIRKHDARRKRSAEDMIPDLAVGLQACEIGGSAWSILPASISAAFSCM